MVKFQKNSHFSAHQHFNFQTGLYSSKNSASTLSHIFPYISTSTFRQAHTLQIFSFQYYSHFSTHQHFNFQTGSYISKNSASTMTHIFPQISTSTFRQAHTFQKIQLPMLLTFFHTAISISTFKQAHISQKFSFHFDSYFSIHQHFNFQTGSCISKIQLPI